MLNVYISFVFIFKIVIVIFGFNRNFNKNIIKTHCKYSNIYGIENLVQKKKLQSSHVIANFVKPKLVSQFLKLCMNYN